MELLSPCCQALIKEERDGQIVYRCSRCPGFAVGLDKLRSLSEPGDFNAFWQGVRAAPSGPRLCLGCEQRMPQFALGSCTLDACESCLLVWLDDGEWHPKEPAKAPPPRELTVEEQKAVLEIRRGSIARAMRSASATEDSLLEPTHDVPGSRDLAAVVHVFRALRTLFSY